MFKWSVIKDNFLTPKECENYKYIIKDYGKENTSQEHYTTRADISDDLIQERFLNVMKVANTIHYKWNISGVRNIAGFYYDKNKFKEEDTFHSDFDEVDTTHKLSGLVYLNDDFEGGELQIWNKKIEPKVGRLVIFPAFAAHKIKQFYKQDRYTMLFVVEGDEFV